MQQIYAKHCLINFMSDKSDNWVGEYTLGPMFHQQRYVLLVQNSADFEQTHETCSGVTLVWWEKSYRRTIKNKKENHQIRLESA